MTQAAGHRELCRHKTRSTQAAGRATVTIWRPITRLLTILAALTLTPALLGSTDAPKYSSLLQADADLHAFGSAHPNCEVWSNWQKTCSRLGSEVSCVEDRARPVRPSAAFCAGGYDSASQAEITSQFRYCRVTERLRIGEREISVCALFDSGRPFNGRRLAARFSPACGEWRVEGSSAPARTRSATGFYCARYLRRRCNDFSDFHSNREKQTATAEGLVMNSSPSGRLDKLAVFGLTCGRES